MRLRILYCLLGSALLISSLASFGCGGGEIKEGIPETAKNQAPPEIPGEKDMNAKLQGKVKK